LSERTRTRKRSNIAARFSSLGTSFDAANNEISGTGTTSGPFWNLRSLMTCSSEFKIAEFDLKISSRNTTSAVGNMFSRRRV
jgi:hypothetical protein